MANEWRIDLLPNFYTNGKPVGQPTPLKHLELINKSSLISSATRGIGNALLNYLFRNIEFVRNERVHKNVLALYIFIYV